MSGEQSQELPRLSSRADYFDYLDGYAVARADEGYEQRPSRELVKSYLLETVGRRRSAPFVDVVFERAGAALRRVDDDLYVVRHPLHGEVALLELHGQRHPVLSTLLHSRDSEQWVDQLVRSSPWLDRLWLSAGLFEQLWLQVQITAAPSRFTRVGFDYEGRFESPHPDRESEDHDEAVDERRARLDVSDTVGTLSTILGELRAVYGPMHSMTRLRMPAEGRGGHDVFHHGKVTNRSDSFLDHRQHVRYLIDAYRRSTEAAEELLWVGGHAETELGGAHLGGAPALLRFAQPLPAPTVRRWVIATFNNERSRFRLSGTPMWAGEAKAHVYGVDRHLWQPLLLEVTPRQLVVVLPSGTCGNTVHRLVTNVQRYLDPTVEAWVGEQRFSSLLADAFGRTVPAA